MSSKGRLLTPLLVGLLSLILLAALLVSRLLPSTPDWASAPPEVRAMLWPEPRPVGEFDFLTQHGESFQPADLRGQWSFLFFGFLDCPDVCPLSLLALRDFRRALIGADPAAERYRYLFVTVDPANDTPDRIGPYVEFFDPDFIGLGGSVESLESLASSLAVRYREVVDERGRRSIDHSGALFVADPSGRVVATFPPPHDPRSMLEQFERLRDYLRS